ncbi:HD-GYP domain-containing protein [Moritella viscosa]|uniref:HDIG domain protein n=1 Tax=Moritella viscosa TaxID=80854 RepID=A0A090KB19_9GAMM|nr:HD domain-containing phosphohydrolase [Moritella viscosa]CED61038.1 putative exported protein [Moritella viscosa]SGZ00929.1 HDIG domain protein [Moritella viscosa]SGZ06979.1 HDIG domain protein [Moritella viscosa]SGZ07153.1 HDIG domain protein [Moritella viscosa]SHO09637.1 HDIG domain protein [Moritella viscosa]
MENVSLAIKDLKVGHYINLPIGWTSHPFILNSFIIKDTKQLQILQHLGFDTISVDLSRSKVTPAAQSTAQQIAPVTNDLALAAKITEQQVALKHAAEQKIQLLQQQVWWKQIRQARSKYQNKITILKDIYSKLSLQPQQAISQLEVLSGELTIAAEQQHDCSFVLCNEELSGDPIYQNAMNIAVLSTRLAQQLSFSSQDIAIVTQTALLSQFGMLWVPSSIRNKKSELTKPEINYLKQHPAYASQKLQGIDALTDIVINSILQINEKFDGSGYPRGIKQDKISKIAQLIAITTRYNEMCNANLPQHRYSPHLAIGLLFKAADKHYNKTYLEQFIKMMGIYPIGTIVNYDNNQAQVLMSIINSLRTPLIVDFTKLEPLKKQPLLRHCGQDNITIAKGISCNDIAPDKLNKFNLIQRNNLYFPAS